ncbi:MAG TPA: DUF3488 and transglutaminase-like domain-containing protein, partial [Ilumatobacteraceae bacterium]
MTAAMAQPRVVHPPRTADVHLPATAALTLLTVVTAIGMCRVFPDWQYLRPMLAVAVGVHAVMCTLRLVKAAAWIALPAGLLALALLLGLIYFRETTRFGLPTGDTIDQFRVSVRLVWQQFPRAVSPVPSEGSFAIAAATGLGLCAWLADSFAFRAYGRAEAVVPAGVLFIFTSALGIDRNRVVTAALWIGAAIFCIAALRLAHSRDDSAWMGKRRQSLWSALPAAVTCALFATTGAAAVAPNLPGAGEKALLDTRNRTSDVTEVVSPLVDIRSQLVNRGNVELFTVRTDTPRYLGLTALAKFDGRRWSVLGEDPRPANGTLADPQVGTEIITQEITIKRLKGQLAPASRLATAANWQGTRGMLWGDESGALYVDGGLEPGYVYQVTAADQDPTADQLRAATSDNPPDAIYRTLPDNMPGSVVDLAQRVTAGATTSYDKARALQDWFQDNFDYTTTVQRGHSNDAMINFLQIQKGYCEQFSGTFAAMARAVGLPTRVMVGFTPGIRRSDGLYHVAGRHAHAWDEVWFDGYGWVLFDPTPGRGAPGAENHTGRAAQQEEGPGNRGGTGTNDNSTPTSVSPPAIDPKRVPDRDQQTGASIPPRIAIEDNGSGGALGGLIIAGAVLLIIAWVVLMPKVINRWVRRRAKTPLDRVSTAWAASV